jgi:hypothetical protein
LRPDRPCLRGSGFLFVVWCSQSDSLILSGWTAILMTCLDVVAKLT